MTEPDAQAEIEAARAYETVFVPALLAEWAPRVADAAQIAAGHRVLDVACGTGVLAREARARTGPAGYVAAIDPGEGMLAVARSLEPAVDWRRGVAEALPFSEDSFDAVVSQFGLMFFTDRDRAIREILRVLRRGRRLAVAVWDSLERIPAFAAEVQLLERLVGRHAAEALHAPFVLGDRESLAKIFERAGAAAVAVASLAGHAEFPRIRVLVEADLRGWLPLMGVTLTEQQIDRILGEAEEALRAFVADGRLSFETRAHVVTASKP